MSEQVSNAIRDVFNSPNVIDANGEEANLVDTTARIADALRGIQDAITPAGVAPGPGAGGDGLVGCLTEAVLDLSHSASRIADAISELAEAVREAKS